jgi:hypothetical protein
VVVVAAAAATVIVVAILPYSHHILVLETEAAALVVSILHVHHPFLHRHVGIHLLILRHHLRIAREEAVVDHISVMM